MSWKGSHALVALEPSAALGIVSDICGSDLLKRVPGQVGFPVSRTNPDDTRKVTLPPPVSTKQRQSQNGEKQPKTTQEAAGFGNFFSFLVLF